MTIVLTITLKLSQRDWYNLDGTAVIRLDSQYWSLAIQIAQLRATNSGNEETNHTVEIDTLPGGTWWCLN